MCGVRGDDNSLASRSAVSIVRVADEQMISSMGQLVSSFDVVVASVRPS